MTTPVRHIAAAGVLNVSLMPGVRPRGRFNDNPYGPATVGGRLGRSAPRLLEEYARSLNLDLSFQNFAHEMEHLASEYTPPTGAFRLAEENGLLLGCVGVRHFSDDAGEIKRLYVIPTARGRGVGRLLVQSIVTAAKQVKYARLLLDTLPSMKEAQVLYLSLGFKPTAAYRFSPVEGTAFLQLELR